MCKKAKIGLIELILLLTGGTLILCVHLYAKMHDINEYKLGALVMVVSLVLLLVCYCILVDTDEDRKKKEHQREDGVIPKEAPWRPFVSRVALFFMSVFISESAFYGLELHGFSGRLFVVVPQASGSVSSQGN